MSRKSDDLPPPIENTNMDELVEAALSVDYPEEDEGSDEETG